MKNLSRLRIPGLAIASGLAFAASWPPSSIGIFLLVALIPFFEAERLMLERKQPAVLFAGCSILFSFVWHLISQSWFVELGVGVALSTMLLNSLLLTLFLVPAHLLKRKGWLVAGDMAFVSGWISFDFLHLNWELAYPLLGLGNGLAAFPLLVQWYEMTGVLGGSCWILVANLLGFRLYRKIMDNSQPAFRSAAIRNWSLSLLLPVALSFCLYYAVDESGQEIEVVALHPEIDCYGERVQSDQLTLIRKYINHSKKALTQKTDYLIWPENAILSGQWLEYLDDMALLKIIRDSFAEYPQLKVITGAVIFEKSQQAARQVHVNYSEDMNWFHYTYNSAVQIEQGNPAVSFRTKQRLVPFEETTPYPTLLEKFRAGIGSLGGFSFSARKSNDHLFQSADGTRVTPLICYESAFGEATGSYVRKGAKALFVLLNEGWYKHWQGAAQFMHFSVLRAIETRRSIARSSNGGISCFISPRGEVLKSASFNVPGAINQTMVLNNDITLYTRYGDFMGLIGVLTWISILVSYASKRFFNFF